MARSHHRKKHKHFQPPPHTASHKPKKNASVIFGIVGAVVGLIIIYSATKGSFAWMIVGAFLGAGVGYLIGRNFDRS